MTSTRDHRDELPGLPPIDDAVAEDMLAGRAVPAGLEPLAAVVRTLREGSRQPVRPTAELAAFLATGGAGRAPAYRVPADRLRAETKRGGTGLVAAGVAAAVVGFGSVGFAGSLPDPVQDRFETVVESVTPYQFPMRSAGPGDPARPPGDSHPGDSHPGDSPPGDSHPGDSASRGGPGGPTAPDLPVPGKGAPKTGAPDARPDPDERAGAAAGNGRPADPPGAGPPTERGDRDAEQPRGNGDQTPGDQATGRQNQPELPGRPQPAG